MGNDDGNWWGTMIPIGVVLAVITIGLELGFLQRELEITFQLMGR